MQSLVKFKSGLQATVRDAVGSDKPYIMAKFMNTLMSGKPPFASRRLYKDWLTWLIHALIRTYDTTVVCDDVDPGIVMGWKISDMGNLVFLYVDESFRGAGIGRYLGGDYRSIVSPFWSRAIEDAGIKFSFMEQRELLERLKKNGCGEYKNTGPIKGGKGSWYERGNSEVRPGIVSGGAVVAGGQDRAG